jgi:hypothetical protein
LKRCNICNITVLYSGYPGFNIELLSAYPDKAISCFNSSRPQFPKLMVHRPPVVCKKLHVVCLHFQGDINYDKSGTLPSFQSTSHRIFPWGSYSAIMPKACNFMLLLFTHKYTHNLHGKMFI